MRSRQSVLIGLSLLAAVSTVGADSTITKVDGGSADSLPFCAVLTTKESGGWVEFDVWASVPATRTDGFLDVGGGDRDSLTAKLSVAGQDSFGGRRWGFRLSRGALDGSVFTFIVYGDGPIPAYDAWELDLGQLYDSALRPYPYAPDAVSPEAYAHKGAPLDSMAAWTERARDHAQQRADHLNQAIDRRRLVIGPSEQCAAFLDEEPN